MERIPDSLFRPRSKDEMKSPKPNMSVSLDWVLSLLAGMRFPEQGGAYDFIKKCAVESIRENKTPYKKVTPAICTLHSFKKKGRAYVTSGSLKFQTWVCVFCDRHTDAIVPNVPSSGAPVYDPSYVPREARGPVFRDEYMEGIMAKIQDRGKLNERSRAIEEAYPSRSKSQKPENLPAEETARLHGVVREIRKKQGGRPWKSGPR